MTHAKGHFLLFGEVTASNRLALWLDIWAELVGMADQDMIISLAQQRLKCQDLQTVAKYNKDLCVDLWFTIGSP